MTFWALSGLINGIASSIFGFFVYFKNRKNTANRLWALFSSAVAFWGYSYFLWQLSADKTEALFWCRSLMLGAIFIPVTFFHFLLVWLDSYRKNKRLLQISYTLSFMAFILNFTPYFIKDVAPILWFKFWPQAGIAYLPFLIFWASLIVYCWYIMFRRMNVATALKRNQTKYVLLGAVIGFSGGFTNYPLWYGIKIPPFGNILVSMYVGLMAYAILKYRLMDIKLALTRAGLIFIIYPLILGMPFWLGSKMLDQAGWWIPVAIMGFLATIGPFLYTYLRHMAESVLLREENRYQRALKDFSSTLIFIRDIEELSQKVVIKIMDAVKLDFCDIYLKQNGVFSLRSKKTMNHPQLPAKIKVDSEFTNSFKNMNAPVLGEFLPSLANMKPGLVCPLFLNRNIYGFIILGSKDKNAIFTDTDIDAFSIVSNQTSLALSEIYYFNEFQKATEEKYKLLVEKERLQSAFEIAEAYRHELGNILNIISTSLGNLMFIGDTVPTKEEIEQTRKSINNNVKKGQRIFNAINKYNENAKSQPKEERLDELLKAVLNEKEEELSKSNIKLKAEIEENLGLSANGNFIFALRYFLEGAIGAIEYTNPKNRLIDIKLQKHEGLGQLIISDTGADATADKLYTGIGIERAKEGGILYFIARRIIFDHQGKLEMLSFNNGKGTSFLIEIPLI